MFYKDMHQLGANGHPSKISHWVPPLIRFYTQPRCCFFNLSFHFSFKSAQLSLQQTRQLGNPGASISFSQIALLEAVTTLEVPRVVIWEITAEAR